MEDEIQARGQRIMGPTRIVVICYNRLGGVLQVFVFFISLMRPEESRLTRMDMGPSTFKVGFTAFSSGQVGFTLDGRIRTPFLTGFVIVKPVTSDSAFGAKFGKTSSN